MEDSGLPVALCGCGSNIIRYFKWNPGKWKHGGFNLWCNSWWFDFDPYPYPNMGDEVNSCLRWTSCHGWLRPKPMVQLMVLPHTSPYPYPTRPAQDKQLSSGRVCPDFGLSFAELAIFDLVSSVETFVEKAQPRGGKSQRGRWLERTSCGRCFRFGMRVQSLFFLGQWWRWPFLLSSRDQTLALTEAVGASYDASVRREPRFQQLMTGHEPVKGLVQEVKSLPSGSASSHRVEPIGSPACCPRGSFVCEILRHQGTPGEVPLQGRTRNVCTVRLLCTQL